MNPDFRCSCGAELADLMCPNPNHAADLRRAIEAGVQRLAQPMLAVVQPADASASYERRRKVVAAIHVALEALSDSDLLAVARFAFRLVPEDERKDGAT